MRPSNSTFDTAYLALHDSIFSSYVSLLTGVAFDGASLRFRNLRSSALLAEIRRSVLDAVALISGRRIPSQIFKTIVQSVSVIVAALVSPLWWTAKGQQYEAMDFHKRALIFLPEHDAKSASIVGRTFESAIPHVFNSAKGRNGIQAFISSHWLPKLYMTPIYVCGIF